MEEKTTIIDFGIDNEHVDFINDVMASFAEQLLKFEAGEINIKEFKKVAGIIAEKMVSKHIRKIK